MSSHLGSTEVWDDPGHVRKLHTALHAVTCASHSPVHAVYMARLQRGVDSALQHRRILYHAGPMAPGCIRQQQVYDPPQYSLCAVNVLQVVTARQGNLQGCSSVAQAAGFIRLYGSHAVAVAVSPCQAVCSVDAQSHQQQPFSSCAG